MVTLSREHKQFRERLSTLLDKNFFADFVDYSGLFSDICLQFLKYVSKESLQKILDRFQPGNKSSNPYDDVSKIFTKKMIL
jgi:hypothetical protein